MKEIKKVIKRLVVPSGKKISLKDYDPEWTAHIKDEKTASSLLADGVKHLAKAQEKLYARDTHSVLMIFQAMDAAGKDGTIRHVMSGINPQGCQVFNFKAPSAEERDHTYLWRSMKALPERGRFGIHNRSYYEEVLVSRVHPEIIDGQQLPDHLKDKEIFERRYREINNFERYLTDNGMIILKFFLHVSKDEQKRRFLSRIDEEEQELEAVRERREGTRVLGRLHARLRSGVHAHQHQGRALAHRSREPQVVHPARGGRGSSTPRSRSWIFPSPRSPRRRRRSFSR